MGPQVLGRSRLQFVGLSVKAPSELAAYHSEVISSLALVCARVVAPKIPDALYLTVSGLQWRPGQRRRGAATFHDSLPDATLVTPTGYLRSNTADIVADRSECVGSALMDFLRGRYPEPAANRVSPSEGEEKLPAFPTLSGDLGSP